jgi:hypothetical protein
MPLNTSVIKTNTDYCVYMFYIWMLSLQNSHTEKFLGTDFNHTLPWPTSDRHPSSSSPLFRALVRKGIVIVSV